MALAFSPLVSYQAEAKINLLKRVLPGCAVLHGWRTWIEPGKQGMNWRHSLNSWLSSCCCKWPGRGQGSHPYPHPHCAVTRQGELHGKHLVDFWNHKQFRPMWLEDLLGNHTTLSPLFLPSWDSLMTLLRQARTPASQLLETTSPSIVQLIDHLLLADMSRTIASSLIISRSFQTKPFFQKVNLTTGLRDEVIKMDDVITVDDVITSGSLKCSLSERVL